MAGVQSTVDRDYRTESWPRNPPRPEGCYAQEDLMITEDNRHKRAALGAVKQGQE